MFANWRLMGRGQNAANHSAVPRTAPRSRIIQRKPPPYGGGEAQSRPINPLPCCASPRRRSLCRCLTTLHVALLAKEIQLEHRPTYILAGFLRILQELGR